MRKIIPIYIIMLLGSAQVIAQFQVGVGGGVSIANITAKEVELGASHRTGLAISIPIYYEMTPRFTGVINPGFVQRGFTNERNTPNFSQRKLNYIQFIPELRYAILDQLYLGLGASYGRMIGHFAKFGSNDWMDVNDFGLGTGKDHEFGITPSVSYNSGSFSFTLRYLHGFSEVMTLDYLDPATLETNPDVSVFSRSFEVAAFYVFGI